MREHKIFALFLGINFLILVAQIQGLSISFYEANILYGDSSLLKSFSTFFINIFGSNDYALRIPMILIHLIATTLLYFISSYYVSRPNDKLWIVFIYLLLPGITSSALLVNIAGLKIVTLFAFVYMYLRFNNWSLILLPLFMMLDATVIFLYFSIVLFGISRKQWITTGVSLSLLIAAILFFGVDLSGRPQGRFLDALGIYSAIFSPVVFIYLFFVLYRRYMMHERDLIWMIASSMFVISLLLSFRQKVNIQDFAPYLMVALPLAAQTFFHTYRVRLPIFRRRYRLLFYSAFTLLMVNALAVFFNQWLYQWIKDPKNHFSYSMHVAKELAHELKDNQIFCVNSDDDKMQLRLRFYGIKECKGTLLSEEIDKKGKKVTISYINIPIYTAYVTKVNK
ncbi:MAG: hypothetical protein PHQ22_04405 [Sulfuricurvum sp.]|nr:hypothetical protein [Sulfuricurvum sp.]MDD5386420.1 hypothetical protein [Sulfuricurvum sp.]